MKKITRFLSAVIAVLLLTGCISNPLFDFRTPDMKNADADALIQATLNELGLKYTVECVRITSSSNPPLVISETVEVEDAETIRYDLIEKYTGYWVKLSYFGNGFFKMTVRSDINAEPDEGGWSRFIYDNPEILELVNRLIIKPFDVEKFYEFEEEYINYLNNESEENLAFDKEVKDADFPDTSGGKSAWYSCHLSRHTDDGEYIFRTTLIEFACCIDPALIKETSSAQASSTPT